MTISGTVTAISPIQTGTSKAGKEYRKIDVVLEYEHHGQWPKAIMFTVFGDNIDKFNLHQGAEYDVEVDFQVHESNGRKFMNANAWKVTAKNAASAPAPTSTTPNLDSLGVQGYQQTHAQQTASAEDDDLPF